MRCFVCISLLILIGQSALVAADVEYQRDVAPLLTKYCAGCHNDGDRDGDFSLESFQSLQKGVEDGPALLAGDPDNSLLVRLIEGTDEPKMPPEDEPAPSAAEVLLIRQWIESGAHGPAGMEPDRLSIVVPAIDSATKISPITSVAYSPGGDALAVTRFAEVELFKRDADQSDWKPLRKIAKFPGKVTNAHFHGGTRLITASGVTGLGGIATIWDWKTGERLQDFKGHRDVMLDAELSPDGKTLATCSYDRQIILWDVATGKARLTMDGHNGAVYDIAFSPDGQLLVSASADDTCKVWRVTDGERMDTLGQPLKEQYSVEFSPDGKFIAAGGADNRIRIWRVRSTDRPRINPLVYARFAHEGAIVKLQYSKDGSQLLSVAEDQSVKVWETKTYTETHLDNDEVDVAMAAAIDPTKQRYTLGRMDGSLAHFEMPTGKMTKQAATSVAEHVVISAEGSKTIQEVEPNTQVTQAQVIDIPAVVNGVIDAEQSVDLDHFKFTAKAGEEWVLEVNAARSKSPLDSFIEVVREDGSSIERVVLQAVRDSYFTFRGKDANQSGDFRVFNWEEMELNEYLYANGEVVKLWLYPRGPDSGFNVYPGSGNRWGYFDTTPLAHALGEPCYIVEPHAPDEVLIPNGLPVFPLYFENDDESRRTLGKDSKLTFTAPADGVYVARIRDVRGFQGKDFKYTLTIRPRTRDFRVDLVDKKQTIHPGSGKEFRVKASRMDNYDGPITVTLSNLPEGLSATSPIVIEEGQIEAMGMLSAATDLAEITPEQVKQIELKATSEILGETVEHAVGGFEEIKVGDKPQITVQITAAEGGAKPVSNPGEPLEFEIEPGETIMLQVDVDRGEFKGEVSFGKEDSGRNLPHGLYVDNIGLNGLLLLMDQSKREFFITAANWVPEQTRHFHLKTGAAGGHTSQPVTLHVRAKK